MIMKFSLSLRNLETKQHEIEHSVMSVSGVFRILVFVCDCSPDQYARIMEVAIGKRNDTFKIQAEGAKDPKWEIIIQVLE